MDHCLINTYFLRYYIDHVYVGDINWFNRLPVGLYRLCVQKRAGIKKIEKQPVLSHE
jgi:hypothetical protein